MDTTGTNGANGEMERLLRYVRLLWRKKWPIGAIWIPIVIAVAGVVMVLPNVYQSTTMILVERQKIPEAYVRTTVTDTMQERLKTISQQILSRQRIRQVVLEYGLVDEASTAMHVLERLHLAGGRLEETVRSWRAKLRGMPESGEEARIEWAIESFKDRVSIDTVGTQAFSVTYEGRDPVAVMRITNAMAGMFITENLKMREARAESTTEFLENQLETARGALEEKEQAMQAFRSTYMGSLPDQLQSNLRTLDRQQLELQHVEEQLAGLSQQRTFLTNQILAADFSAADLSEDTRLALAQLDPISRQLAVSEDKLINLKTQYTDKHPKVIQLEAEIAELRKALEARSQGKDGEGDGGGVGIQLSRIDTDERNLQAKRARLESEIGDYQRRVELTPQIEQKMQQLDRDYKIMQANYQSLLEKKIDARLAESLERRQQSEQFLVIDPANLPIAPIRPNRKMILFLGIVGGFTFAAGIFVVRDLLRPMFHTAEEVQADLGLPVLGIIPRAAKLEHGS